MTSTTKCLVQANDGLGYITNPAVLAAALHMAAQDPDAVLLFAPSDHLFPDAAAGQPDGLGQIFNLFRSSEAVLL